MIPVNIYNYETRESIGINQFQKVPNKGEYVVLKHDGKMNYSTIRDNKTAYKVVGVILYGENATILIDLNESLKVGDLI